VRTIRKEAYERLKSLLAMDDFDPDEGTALMNELMADDDFGDPLLESYQHYDRIGGLRKVKPVDHSIFRKSGADV
jgi:hypothetical protein